MTVLFCIDARTYYFASMHASKYNAEHGESFDRSRLAAPDSPAF